VQSLLVGRIPRFSRRPTCRLEHGARQLSAVQYAPQQEHFIVTSEYENRKLAPAKRGLASKPGEHGRARYSINAKAETVESRPTFAAGFAHRRCVIPANGIPNGPDRSINGSRFGFTAATVTSSLFAGLDQNGENNDNHPGNFHHPDLCSKLNPGHDT
jgi:putative SOS response-associated peptidase YedK